MVCYTLPFRQYFLAHHQVVAVLQIFIINGKYSIVKMWVIVRKAFLPYAGSEDPDLYS